MLSDRPKKLTKPVSKEADMIKQSSFWSAFEKRAGGSPIGGKGFFGGAGKGNLGSKGESPERQGTQQSHGSSAGEETRPRTDFLDRERNPRDFAPGATGLEFQVESNPHIKY